MESALIVTAWVCGMVSGTAMLLGGIGLVTGHVVFNPRRIDWSVGEARLLGAILAVQGFFVGAATLATVLQISASTSAPPALLPSLPVIGVGGFLGTFAVGQHHNRRNPSKRW